MSLMVGTTWVRIEEQGDVPTLSEYVVATVFNYNAVA